MNFRKNLLQLLYKVFKFSLKGDVSMEKEGSLDLSCIINFYGRMDLLDGILFSLSSQTLEKEAFEIILVEDRGGTEEGKKRVQIFKEKLNIKYTALEENFGKMGYSRNVGLMVCKGKHLLFLDDDTIIHDENFLARLLGEFASNPGIDAIVPRGSASFSTINERYSYHDPFFPSNRCTAYRREALVELGGFVSAIVGQEEVEFLIRFISAGKKHKNTDKISFLHPPYILNNLNKAKAVGLSFGALRKRYPLIVWTMMVLNGMRQVPLLLLWFNKKHRTHGFFGLGFFIGVVLSFFGKNAEYK